MPIVHQKEHLSTKITIWEITEVTEDLYRLANLSSGEVSICRQFKSESRIKEFLAVRALLRLIYPNENLFIEYNKDGKPLLRNRSISISHSKNYVAVLTGDFEAGGIDIEIMNDRIFLLAEKFLNEEELAFLGPQLTAEKLQIAWGAKEILYKIHSIGDVDFKKHLLIHPFAETVKGHLTAELRKKGFEKIYTIYFEKFRNLMVSWGTNS